MLHVKQIPAVASAEAIPQALDQAGIDFHPIANVNWKEYPYQPEAAFRIAHTGNHLLLHFRIKEASVRARYGEDNGNVWTDSCVEFFCQPNPEDGIYYNLECNCIATILLGAGAERKNRQRATQEVMNNIERWASLGRQPFEERTEEQTWEVALLIPATTYFQHQLQSFTGLHIRANFYKCGDELQTPHFLSWNPIDNPTPNFHLPAYFDQVEFA